MISAIISLKSMDMQRLVITMSQVIINLLHPTEDNMRIILVGIVVVFGTMIGVNSITTVSKLQDSKMTRFCKSAPIGASYDDICKDFR